MNRITLLNGYSRKKVKTVDKVSGIPLTLERLLAMDATGELRHGTTFWFVCNDGQARQVRVNGRLKKWKRDEARVELPIAFGMYEKTRLGTRDLGRLLVDVEQWTEARD